MEHTHLLALPGMHATDSPSAAAHWDRSLNALVLIVEDEPEIADIVAAYLHREGLRTVRAQDGIGALAMHRSARPDLILLDVQMPGMDGWNVLNTVRQRGDTPVIMLTALDQGLDKLTALRMGADDYVVKPFNPAEGRPRARRPAPHTQCAWPGQTRHPARRQTGDRPRNPRRPRRGRRLQP